MLALPIISIVTIVKNNAEYLSNTIKSVVEQKYPDVIEYIIIDGGSTDGSLSIIQAHADRLAFWSSEPDKGPADAINKGFSHATGDILLWLNSDDLLLPNAVKTAVQALSKHQAQFTYGHSQLIDADGKVFKNLYTSPQSYRSYRYDNGGNIFQGTVLFKRELWEKYGPLDTNLKCAFEYQLFDKFFRYGKGVFINRKLAQYRIHGRTITALQHERFPIELAQIRPALPLAPLYRFFFRLLRLVNWIIYGNILKSMFNC